MTETSPLACIAIPPPREWEFSQPLAVTSTTNTVTPKSPGEARVANIEVALPVIVLAYALRGT
jgi:hypothetical protein